METSSSSGFAFTEIIKLSEKYKSVKLAQKKQGFRQSEGFQSTSA